MQTMDALVKVRRGDQARALWLSTIAFTVCFAVWTIFSIIGVQIKRDLGLTETQFGLLVGTPILTGSLIRLILGIWTDQDGGRIVYVAVMLSALRTSPSGIRRRRKARRSAFLAPAMLVLPSPNSSRPSSWSPTAGRQS